MVILLNGKKMEAGGANTIADVVEKLQLPRETVLIEYNGLALHRHEWSTRPISDGDRVELIRVVAGG